MTSFNINRIKVISILLFFAVFCSCEYNSNSYYEDCGGKYYDPPDPILVGHYELVNPPAERTSIVFFDSTIGELILDRNNNYQLTYSVEFECGTETIAYQRDEHGTYISNDTIVRYHGPCWSSVHGMGDLYFFPDSFESWECEFEYGLLYEKYYINNGIWLQIPLDSIIFIRSGIIDTLVIQDSMIIEYQPICSIERNDSLNSDILNLYFSKY